MSTRCGSTRNRRSQDPRFFDSIASSTGENPRNHRTPPTAGDEKPCQGFLEATNLRAVERNDQVKSHAGREPGTVGANHDRAKFQIVILRGHIDRTHSRFRLQGAKKEARHKNCSFEQRKGSRRGSCFFACARSKNSPVSGFSARSRSGRRSRQIEKNRARYLKSRVIHAHRDKPGCRRRFHDSNRRVFSHKS